MFDPRVPIELENPRRGKEPQVWPPTLVGIDTRRLALL
jgi:hypothetical protein